MEKADFLKTWRVNKSGPYPADVPQDGTFNIYDDGDDKVLIQYDGFGSAYPSFQNGIHDGADEITAMFSESQRITMVYWTNGGTPNLDITIAETSGGSSLDKRFAVCPTEFPELGEWGAEADPG